MAYGGSQARGLIGAVASGLRQSHSNARSEEAMFQLFKHISVPLKKLHRSSHRGAVVNESN